VHAVINELPEQCRIIFKMKKFDGLKYSEIADIKNISVKTVETQMGRALKYLRKRLAVLLTVISL
jgi:RNA polymerase sigma-70 factor (ECF subfamily)